MCILHKLLKYLYFMFKTSTGEDSGIHAVGGGISQVFTHGKDDPYNLVIFYKKREFMIKCALLKWQVILI